MSKEVPNGRLQANQTYSSQRNATGSPLLRLPAEIRNKIWEYACGGQAVVLPAKRGLTEKGRAVSFSKLHLTSASGLGMMEVVYRRSTHRALSAFHLPEVCRQIYVETNLTSYKTNAFVLTTSIKVNNRAARLMAAQRRAIATIQPTPFKVCYMTYDDDLSRTISWEVWPNVRRIVITFAAIEYVQLYHTSICKSGIGATWGYGQWVAWVLDRLKWCQEAGLEVVLEGIAP